MRGIHLLFAAAISFIFAAWVLVLFVVGEDCKWSEPEIGQHSELVRMLEEHKKELEDSAK